ncbi:MAG: PQQ-binding-like beta-propeller repeat protein [Planctomycetota bacterium]
MNALRFLLSMSATIPALLLCGGASADGWPHWRGPNQDGVAQGATPPTTWSATENILWRLPLPGPAGSTPVVAGGRLMLTSQDGPDISLLCVSDEGEMLWKRSLGNGTATFREDEGNLASPSPSTDGKHVWAFAGNGSLACFDLEGNEAWSMDVDKEYGPFDIQFGMASTPVLHGGRLYLQLIHGDGDPDTEEARVICLEAATGKEVWSRKRLTGARAECEHSYASPLVYRGKEGEFLVTHGADYAIAYRLDDGGELWRCGGMNSPGNYHSTLRFVASPGFSDGLIVVPTAKNGPVLAVAPAASGEVAEGSGLLWRYPENTPDVPSPLVLDGLVYLCRENGNLLCLDAQTGKKVYQKRTTVDRHRASPLAADGKLYLTSRAGVVSVVQAGREFELLASNDVEEPIASSPVAVGNRLYLRTYQSLLAISETKAPGQSGGGE